MIKLAFQLARTVERVYESSRVVIGLESPDLIDVPMDDSTLLVDHLVIIDSDGEFWALNQTNDPFVTVNGRPFGRKILRNGDRLMIGGVAIIFEGEAQSPQSAIATIIPMLERKISEHQSETVQRATPTVRPEKTAVVKQQVAFGDDREVLALLQEVDALAPPTAFKMTQMDSERTEQDLFEALLSEAASTTEAPIGLADPLPPSLLQPNLLQPTEDRRQSTTAPAPEPGLSWNLWAAMGAFLGLLILGVGIGIFATFSEQSDQQEYLAAQNLSDVAMALTYAQIHQVKPQNQNWTDPDFIRANVDRVLNGYFATSVDIDPQGYLKDNPYLLRIYTNHDASQFLLMAQPAFSLWHWFTRQHSILLDSTAMELRRTGDLRALNRLMSNPNALTGSNALEVSRVVREAELITLKALAKESRHREFIPPRELKIVLPGAENLVHNAPRYYRFGEPVLDALSKVGEEATPELKNLGEQLQRFRRLSRLVLYTSEDKSIANRAYRTLKKHFPSESALVGYLTFHPQTGAYVSSQLLSEEFSKPKQLSENTSSLTSNKS